MTPEQQAEAEAEGLTPMDFNIPQPLRAVVWLLWTIGRKLEAAETWLNRNS